MKVRLLILGVMLCAAQHLAAQARTVTGAVKDKSSGESIPGVAVTVENTATGAFTDVDGKYTVQVSDNNAVLVFTMLGYSTQKIPVGSQSAVNIDLNPTVLDEVVITALGIPRDRKSLGYALQKIEGSDVSTAKETNFINSLQGKAAGIQVIGSSNLGGSAKIMMRGAHSILGNNDPLIVVDGIPINNNNFKTNDQERGALGYDYGNSAQDINSYDISEINVLRGPAAALYGSRGANGVILITTQKGRMRSGSGKMPIGVSINQSYGFDKVSILPKYQDIYGGGGVGEFFESTTFPTQLTHDFTCDCSWGPKMDDGTNVIQWYAYDQKYHPEKYGVATPFESNPDNVKDFFQTGETINTNVALDGANETSSFRLSLNNLHQKGVMENSKLNRKTISFNGTHKLSEKLSAGAGVNYVNTDVKGRAETGYSNLASNFTQWWQRQLDMEELRDYKNPDGSQRSWNRSAEDDPSPLYWNNPFWTIFENYETDQRERVFGNLYLGYQITDNLSVKGSTYYDTYYDSRQERIAVGSIDLSKYSEDNYHVSEVNYEFMANYHKRLNDDNDLAVFVGTNRRNNNTERAFTETRGGLNTPGFYSLLNGADGVGVQALTTEKRVNSIFGGASYGFKNFLYLDLTLRSDWSSSLPEENNPVIYPSAGVGFIYSEFIDAKALTFGKLRLSYVNVGNDTDPYRLLTLPGVGQNSGNNGLFYLPAALNNPDLKPENISTFEVGTDISLFVDRVSLDVTYYNSTTKDLIFNVAQSATSGYTSRYINAGELNNKGWEISGKFIPVTTQTGWEIGFGLNWARNRNEVVELYTDENGNEISSVRIGQAPFAVTVEAKPGEAYGQLVGYDFLYDDAGNKLVDDDGFYQRTETVQPLGSYLADFTGGVSLWVKYKGLKLYALFDYQKGGNLFSLTNTWGKYSGTLEETAEGSIREDGIIVEGVHDDGSTNTTSIAAVDHFFANGGYVIAAADVYDASFIKFRECRLTYDFSPKFLGNSPVRGLTVGVTGRNLALLLRNAPNIDPEAAVSTGNIQGIEGGQLPTTRNISFFLGIQF